MIQALVFGASVSVMSWIVSLILIVPLERSSIYQKLQNLNFVSSVVVNRAIGIEGFRWFVRDTPFRFFNPAVRLGKGRGDLVRLRDAMTRAEVSHLIGFVLVALVAIYMAIISSGLVGVMIMVANTVLNLYPSLLQQANKRRIDRLLARVR